MKLISQAPKSQPSLPSLIFTILGAIVIASMATNESVHADVFVQQARDDVPVVRQVLPPALTIGEEATVTFVGERLIGLNKIMCLSALRLKRVVEATDKSLKVIVEVDSSATTGTYPLYVLCKSGLSNPRLVRIDPSAKCTEQEDNNTTAAATSIQVPCGVSGTLLTADRDVFSFQAAEGARLTFDFHGVRLGSPIRSVLTLLDADGKQLARAAARSARHEDEPLLVYEFPKSDQYFICVSDLTYQGADYCAYYLRVGEHPVATELFPLGGQQGTSTNFTLSGGNLTQPRQISLELNETQLPIQRPDAAFDEHSLAFPLSIAAGRIPELLESNVVQPDNQMNTVRWPCTINGRLERRGEVDKFRMRLGANQETRIRVIAQRLGSRLDSVLIIKDEAGKEVASADDTPTKDRQPPVVRDNDDPQFCDDAELEFTAPKAGIYSIELTDRFKAGGSRYAYRLEIDEPRPDFELLVQPGKVVVGDQKQQRNRRQQVVRDFHGQGTGSLSVDKGGQGTLAVRLVRRGYDGPVELNVAGLPEGLQARPATIAAGQNQTELVLYADFDAASASSLVTVTGIARSANQEIVRRAVNPVVFASTPLGGAAQDELDVVAVGISGQGAKLALRGKLNGELVPGSTTRLVLEVRRREGIIGKVEVRPANAPTGLTVPAVVLAEDEDSATIELNADPSLLSGSRTLRFEAQLQPKSKSKKKTEPLLAITDVPVEVQPLVSLQCTNQKVDVVRGRQTRLTIQVHRSSNFSSAIKLTPDRLPKGVTVEPSTITGQGNKFELVFEASSDASASPIRRVVQLKPTTRVGNMPIELPSLRFALKVIKQ